MGYAIHTHILVSVIFNFGMGVWRTGSQHGITGQHVNYIQKTCFTQSQDIPDIYSAYTMYIPCIYQSKVSCQRFVAHACLAASDQDFRRISVLATEGLPTRGWGRPKFHNQVLISLTWLPLRKGGPVPSAQPHSIVSLCLLLYLCGIVAFPMYISSIYCVYTGQDVIYQLYTRNIRGIYHMVYTMCIYIL